MLESCVLEFGVSDSNVIFGILVFEVSLYLDLVVGCKVEESWRLFESECFKSTVVDQAPAKRVTRKSTVLDVYLSASIFTIVSQHSVILLACLDLLANVS